MELGLKIKKYLEDNGISQTFISKKTGIELPKLNLALNGNRRFTFNEYELICGALKVNGPAIDKLGQYEDIGTVQEVRAAMEHFKTKK